MNIQLIMKKQLLSFVALLCVVWLTPTRALAWDFEVDGIYYTVTSSSYPHTVEVASHEFYGTITIPEIVVYDYIAYTVTSIGEEAFAYCSDNISVKIPATVTSIGHQAFYQSTGLISIEIPASVISIGDEAFRECSGLTSIEIPKSVTSIGAYAFMYCTGLTSIEIPNSVTSIGDGAFQRCSGLTSINIPASVTSIGRGAFARCSGLTSIEIPNSVTSIEHQAFYYCSGLKSIKIPASVTAIGEYAFMNCSGLTSIEIPASVTSIEHEAFSGCSGLTEIFSRASEPPVCNYKAWLYVNKSTCTLYVPAGTKDAYAAASEWEDFINIEEFDTTDITALDAEATDTDLSDCEIYTAGGQRVDELQAGTNIVRMKNGKVKKIVKR